MLQLKMVPTYPSPIERAHKVIAEFLIPRCKSNEARAFFDVEIFQSLHREGLLHMTLPAIYGGQGMTVLEMVDILKMIGGISGGIAGSMIGNILGTAAVLGFGSKELVKRITEDGVQNYFLWSFAMTEQNIGSDVKYIETKAIKTSDGYLITGEKNYITNASFSKYISLYAQTYDEQGNHKGISCFLIEGNPEGLKRGEPLKKFVFRESNTSSLFLNQVLVPHENLLGEEGQGLKILQACIGQSKTLLAAVGVGIAERALYLVENYLQETSRFGKKLIEQKVIPHLLVQLHAQTQAAWLLTQKSAQTWDQFKIAVSESSIAKLMAGQCATNVTSECMELFGAQGLMLEHEIHRLYKEAKAIEIIEGTSRVQEIIVMNQMYRFPKPKVVPPNSGAAL